jgi:membrane protease YdiL (CAAX protease family)
MITDIQIQPIILSRSIFLFGIPAVIFFILVNYLIPFINTELNIDPILVWFLVGGAGIFIPLFIITFILLKREQYNLTKEIIVLRLRLTKPGKREIYISLLAALCCFIFSGLIITIYNFISDGTQLFGHLNTSPGFLEYSPSNSNPLLVLAIWIPFFFFNIFGEELLWRGFILPGQILYHGKSAWILNAILWLLFHLCFGFGLILTLLPILFILPYLVQKYKNTWIGIFIHALYNGPIFILLTAGVIQ